MKTKKTIKIPSVEFGHWDENHIKLTQTWPMSGGVEQIIVSESSLSDLVDKLVKHQNKELDKKLDC